MFRIYVFESESILNLDFRRLTPKKIGLNFKFMHKQGFFQDTWKMLNLIFFCVHQKILNIFFSYNFFLTLRESGLSKNTTSDVGASKKLWRRRVKKFWAKKCQQNLTNQSWKSEFRFRHRLCSSQEISSQKSKIFEKWRFLWEKNF